VSSLRVIDTRWRRRSWDLPPSQLRSSLQGLQTPQHCLEMTGKANKSMNEFRTGMKALPSSFRSRCLEEPPYVQLRYSLCTACSRGGGNCTVGLANTRHQSLWYLNAGGGSALGDDLPRFRYSIVSMPRKSCRKPVVLVLVRSPLAVRLWRDSLSDRFPALQSFHNPSSSVRSGCPKRKVSLSSLLDDITALHMFSDGHTGLCLGIILGWGLLDVEPTAGRLPADLNYIGGHCPASQRHHGLPSLFLFVLTHSRYSKRINRSHNSRQEPEPWGFPPIGSLPAQLTNISS
jgi:hypothetical protein